MMVGYSSDVPFNQDGFTWIESCECSVELNNLPTKMTRGVEEVSPQSPVMTFGAMCAASVWDAYVEVPHGNTLGFSLMLFSLVFEVEGMLFFFRSHHPPPSLSNNIRTR
jgi:hypothetical protein